MKPVYQFVVFVLTTGVLIQISCKKTDQIVAGVTPTANAGPDQKISFPANSVHLDGSGSTDRDGKINGFLWTKIVGPSSFTIVNSHAKQTAVTNLVPGIYQFELKVTDDGGLFSKDTLQVVVVLPNNHPPIAIAGSTGIIHLPSNTATLYGDASYDPDGNIFSYAWAKISGPSSPNIISSNAPRTLVYSLVEGIYLFELTVTDVGGLFSKDTTTLIVSSDCSIDNRPLINAQLIPFGTLSQTRYGMAVASAGNKVFFAGAGLTYDSSSSNPEYGSSRVDIYDLATHIWTTAELSAWRADIAAVAAGNKVFFAGGRLGDGAFDQFFSTIDIYDVSTNTWSVASLSESRAYISAGAVGNKVFFAGGEKDWDYNTSAKVDMYDISTKLWSTAQLSEARAHISAVTVNNKIYFAGGHTEGRWYNPSNKIDIYDNATNSWSVAALSEPMGNLAGTNLADKIYWTRGCTVEIRDVNNWSSSMNHLFKPTNWSINAGQNVVVKNNKIVFFMGWGTGNKFDIYDVNTKAWSIGVLPFDIGGASIIGVNNTIYVAGGLVNGKASNKVWKLEF